MIRDFALAVRCAAAQDILLQTGYILVLVLLAAFVHADVYIRE